MLEKNRPIEIDENNIFLNDKLKRETEIKNLSMLIESTKEPFTMSINGEWGAGKTTFIKLWQAYLNKEYGIKSIYFSAWEDDFLQEPLISILGEISNYISDNFSEDKTINEPKDEIYDLELIHPTKNIPWSIICRC